MDSISVSDALKSVNLNMSYGEEVGKRIFAILSGDIGETDQTDLEKRNASFIAFILLALSQIVSVNWFHSDRVRNLAARHLCQAVADTFCLRSVKTG